LLQPLEPDRPMAFGRKHAESSRKGDACPNGTTPYDEGILPMQAHPTRAPTAVLSLVELSARF
jgi:hypothetical protein